MVRDLSKALPLSYFIRRRQILSTYRALLKQASKASTPSLKNDLISQIRQEFQNSKHLTDVIVINACIKHATRSLSLVEDIVTSSASKDSWVGTTTSDGLERGRVGEGWPWES